MLEVGQQEAERLGAWVPLEAELEEAEQEEAEQLGAWVPLEAEQEEAEQLGASAQLTGKEQ
jgi:hypothetical protein